MDCVLICYNAVCFAPVVFIYHVVMLMFGLIFNNLHKEMYNSHLCFEYMVFIFKK